jgi:hypothetical protein
MKSVIVVLDICGRLCNSPMASSATILTTMLGGLHSDTNASTAYWANDRQMMAICEGFNTNVETHEKMNAGADPNASMK